MYWESSFGPLDRKVLIALGFLLNLRRLKQTSRTKPVLFSFLRVEFGRTRKPLDNYLFIAIEFIPPFHRHSTTSGAEVRVSCHVNIIISAKTLAGWMEHKRCCKVFHLYPICVPPLLKIEQFI
jgi:hypothetical protein